MTKTETANRMPVVFVGHGSPMNVIEDNQWSRGFKSLAKMVPRPAAILAISAHWFVDGTLLTADAHPRTIHDFGGFPPALYEIQYPAPGNVDRSTETNADRRGVMLLDEFARGGLDRVENAGCAAGRINLALD